MVNSADNSTSINFGDFKDFCATPSSYGAKREDTMGKLIINDLTTTKKKFQSWYPPPLSTPITDFIASYIDVVNKQCNMVDEKAVTPPSVSVVPKDVMKPEEFIEKFKEISEGKTYDQASSDLDTLVHKALDPRLPVGVLLKTSRTAGHDFANEVVKALDKPDNPDEYDVIDALKNRGMKRPKASYKNHKSITEMLYIIINGIRFDDAQKIDPKFVEIKKTIPSSKPSSKQIVWVTPVDEVGEKTKIVLKSININSCEELAKQTPEELKKALIDIKAGTYIMGRIKRIIKLANDVCGIDKPKEITTAPRILTKTTTVGEPSADLSNIVETQEEKMKRITAGFRDLGVI